MKVLLTTLNAKYIHKNLALRYIYRTAPASIDAYIREFTIKDKEENIVNEILKYDADIIGFSTYIWNVDHIQRIVAKIKERNPNVHIFLGGPEVSFEPEYFLDNFAIDAVSCGEGEFTVWQYVQHYQDEIVDVDGFYTRTCKPTVGYAISDIKEIEKYEPPYFFDFDKKDMGNRYLYVETSRGCPYRCSYCLSSVLGNVRLFSTEYVKKVLDQIFKSDAKIIKFLDRTFNVDKKRALDLAMYIDSNARKDQIFEFEIMAEQLSEELITFLENRQPYPVFRFEIGIQTTNKMSLQEIHRIQNFEKLSAVVNRLGKNKTCTMHVDLIAGLPFEDLESFKHSFDDVFNLHAAELQLGFLKLLRGTIMKNNKDEYGMSYSANAPYEIFETKWMTKDDLIEIHKACYALDVLYNKPRMRRTIDYIVTKYPITPFDLFNRLGNDLYEHKYNQIDLIFKSVIQSLQPDILSRQIIGLLNEEYYCLFKQKTKRIFEYSLDEEIRKKCQDVLFENGIASRNDLSIYGIFAKGSDDSELFVLYNQNQTYPRLFKVWKEHVEELML